MKILTKLVNWLFYDATNDNAKVVDDQVLFAALCLIAIGIMMVYSASIAYAANDKIIHNQYYYVIRHIGYIIVGMIAAVITFNVPTSLWRKYAGIIGFVVILLLVAVLIPHLGKVVNGSRRWIGIGMLNLQPSEFAKLGMVIFLANYICSKPFGLTRLKQDVLPVFGGIAFVALLLLLEPDMGSATVVFIIALGILFMADIDYRIILGFTLIGAISFIALIVVAPYRMRRVLGFINPWQDALGKGYQLTHSLLAVGHGGWFGVGLGNSIEKLFYLPEAHTDFILAIIAEETGIIGVAIIMILFWIIFYRGFNIIANEAYRLGARKFQGLLAQGISLWFFTQAVVNVGVTIGILPTKGLTLPFVSFGGSSILVSSIALAILLKIDYENKLIKRGVIVH